MTWVQKDTDQISVVYISSRVADKKATRPVQNTPFFTSSFRASLPVEKELTQHELRSKPK